MTAGANAPTAGLNVDYTANYAKIATVKCLRPFGQVKMNRAEVITGLQALRHEIEKIKQNVLSRKELTFEDCEYYDDVLAEAKLAVLLNEQNDPHAKL
jgi:hypothetical protein